MPNSFILAHIFVPCQLPLTNILNNPAADIYLQLVKKHHCPKSTEGTPRTLTELKIYWRLLDPDKHPILIFYENAIAATQCFSQTFLDALTRFDATICLITDSSHPIIPTFSTQDPHPIQSILYLPGCNAPYYKTSR